MPRTSQAQAQLVAEIARLIGTGEHSHAIARLFAERNVSADVVRVWSDFEGTSPTGYPAQPTGATEGDAIIDAMGASDPQTELDYLRRRLDQITQQVTNDRAGSYATHEATKHARDPKTGQVKRAIPVRKANDDDTTEALKRLGYTVTDFDPFEGPDNAA